MKNLRRVIWSRGMFLTPQHFQTQDNFIEELLQFRLTSSQFANWGVVSLEIDREALTNGMFTVRGCRGVMPDGTVFSIPDPDAPPTGRTIADHFQPNQDGLDVFLALPDRQANGRNFTLVADPKDSSVSTRYLSETLDVLDETATAESKSVQVARKNLRLLFGSQNLDGFVTLRIARVVRNPQNAYILDPAFIPPCLSIAGSESLQNLLRRQIEILISKAESLNASRRQRSQGLADFNTSESASFWLLHTVNSCVPELQHIWNVTHGHPETLWSAMLRLAGALSTFSLDSKAQDLPGYEHDDLGGCFTALDTTIRSLVETVIPSKCVPIPLRLVERSHWTGTISNDDYFKNGGFFLSLSAKMSPDELINKVPQLVKVAPPDEMQNLIRLALPGISLRHAPTVPGAIAFKLNNQYYSLSQTGRLWERIVQSRGISLFIPPEIAEAQPEILVVLQ